ncbi:MAG: 2-succinyl-6-hydroxy-2,4-cyclohexadiene-1-carboxylate synthase [Leptolyngbyaceae cyanobacterium MO_188.B28]|nr:2-succinyl-6-hydroxy-2,4-cyclohexadiene-1-carboxylate synthase [Leptolyngbyaceae cyanobacterium MO_188.B28]
MSGIASRCFESPFGKFHYLDSGQDNTETIAFLHGFTGSSRDFLTLPGEILNQYRCLMPDLPGHGRTQVKTAANTFQPEGQVTLLQQWLNALGQTRFHLFGYSMGGRLALQFAVRHPQLLNSLILVSTTAGIRHPELRQKRARSDLQLAQTILNTEPVDFLTWWVSQPLFQGIADQGEDFIAQEVNRRLPIHPEGLANSLKSFGSGVMPHVWSQLGQITVPVLVIVGSRDSKYLSIATELVDLMPNARLEILETTHAPLVESPDALWEKVADFLSSYLTIFGD